MKMNYNLILYGLLGLSALFSAKVVAQEIKPAKSLTAALNGEPADFTVELKPAANISTCLVGRRQMDMRRGTLNVDGINYSIYLPAKGPYPLTDTSTSYSMVTSEKTMIFVDYNGNSKVDEGECWFAEFPIRFGNKMLSIKSIDPDGKTLQLTKSTVPLAGLVLGLKAPDFELKDQNGKVHTLKDYSGKYLIIDVWSTSCHSCMKKMPHVLELQKQYGTDKLEVLLLSIDNSYRFEDPEKQNIDAVKRLNMPWPNILIPNGWKDAASKLNIQCYGLYMINPEGKVVVYNGFMPEVETALNFKMKETAATKANKH